MYSIKINDGYYTCTPAFNIPNAIQLNVNRDICSHTQAPIPDFSAIPNITTNTRISLAGTFCGDRNLSSIDFTNWTHKTIVSLSATFKSCLNLHTIKGFETLDLSSCDDYQEMCYNCPALREIDISNRAIKAWGWELKTTDAFAKCPVLHTAVITTRAPEFTFPPHTTIVDLNAGVNRIFTERIAALEQQLSSKDKQLSTLRMDVDILRQQLSAILTRLPELGI